MTQYGKSGFLLGLIGVLQIGFVSVFVFVYGTSFQQN